MTADPARAQPSTLNISLWIVQALLALTLVGTAIWKVVTPIPELAARMPWMGEVSPVFLRTTALFDGLGGLGVIVPTLTRVAPRLAVAAAIGIVLLMLSAIAFHFSRGEAAATPFNVLVAGLAAFVAWGRRRS